jgi:uncharacterized membrane protein
MPGLVDIMKLMQRCYLSTRARLGLALGLSSVVSVVLYVAGPWGSYEPGFAYMNWNLFLAWLAFAVTLWLERTLRRSLWSGWYALLLTGMWLVFLPNTFYMLTDFIHIQELSTADLVLGVVMLSSFILNGLLLGFLSVYVVHRELAKRVKPRTAAGLLAAVFFTCSFAIYVGRELRWNTWDVLTNPFSVLLDVTEHLFNPSSHPGMFGITAGFFLLLTSLYAVVWHAARAARQEPVNDRPG